MNRYSADQEDCYEVNGVDYYPEEPEFRIVNGHVIARCSGCAFNNAGTHCMNAPACNSSDRLDRRTIIWVKA